MSFIDGALVAPGTRVVDVVRNPATGEAIGEVAQATAEDLEHAILVAERAFAVFRTWPRHKRHDLCEAVATRLRAERQELAELMARDAGKPLSMAQGEVDRAVLTFSLAADEARRFGGEVVPLDVDPRAAAMTSVVHRFPIGPVAAISPFNFPLNLLAHKVAPALAVGTSVVAKPPPQCPLTAFRLAQIVHECGAPPGTFNVLHMPVGVAEKLATDPRFALLSFTGSAAVGWHLKSIAGKKRVVLELGGNAAAVVHEDCGDVDAVASRLALGAFAYAGQVCIKVQRVLVHGSLYSRFSEAFVRATQKLVVGDPMRPETSIGPMIDEKAAERVDAWVDEAVRGGARALVRGSRSGALLGPTVLADVKPEMKVSCQEVFGPVATVSAYDDFDAALDVVNDSPYGLQAGVFTSDVRRIFRAFEKLEVGGVVANDFPTMRVDNYPYGGVKDSGFGREGVRYAMEDMTEPRILVLNLGR
jgi:acyl-CoA reductase-like NAD-dependent aldehyde dehydrogenase